MHESTKRNYLARMIDSKVECMLVAKNYSGEYWDGDRRFGYGGYKFIPGYLNSVARELMITYGLGPGSKILDVGCGKGFLLHELLLLEPGLTVIGFDTSVYGIENSTDLVRPYLNLQKAQAEYPYENDEFDLVISLGALHNLKLFDLKVALTEIERVGKNAYIMMESYRNEKELFNLQCWALTCESFFCVDEWLWIYDQFGYTGDYEFIFFK